MCEGKCSSQHQVGTVLENFIIYKIILVFIKLFYLIYFFLFYLILFDLIVIVVILWCYNWFIVGIEPVVINVNLLSSI